MAEQGYLVIVATYAKTRPIAPPPERDGYEINYGASRQRVAYSAGGPLFAAHVEVEAWWKRPTTEARLGLITFGGGLVWASRVQTIDVANLFRLLMTPGPLEFSAIGLLLWLHAKWRRAVRVK
jgi:hypothetical protein